MADFDRAIELVMAFPPMRAAAGRPEVRSALASIMRDNTWANMLDESAQTMT